MEKKFGAIVESEESGPYRKDIKERKEVAAPRDAGLMERNELGRNPPYLLAAPLTGIYTATPKTTSYKTKVD